MKSGTSSNSAASSTPAARPSDSQSDADTLPGAGADRGDIYDLNDALTAELAQLSDVPNDETGATPPETAADAETETEEGTDALENAADAALAEETADADDPDAEAAEGETDSAETDAAAAKDADSKKPDDDAKSGFQARIDELTHARRTAEEQLAKANERLAHFEAQVAGRLEPEVLEHVDDPAQLEAAQKKFTALHLWAVKNPDGGKLGDREYSAEEARELQAQTFSLINDALPKRRAYLDKKAQYDAAAVNWYPWMKDTTRGDGAALQQGLQMYPQLRAVPNYRLFAGDAYIGGVLRQRGIAITPELLTRLEAEAKKPATKGAAPAKAAPVPGRAPVKAPAAPSRAGVIPPRTSPQAAKQKAAAQRLKVGTGSEDDLAAYIESKL